MALVSMALPASFFREWQTPKFLNATLSLYILLGMAALFFGLMLTAGHAARGGQVTLRFSSRQVEYLKRAYRVLFTLTVAGYILWIASAALRGANLSDLSAVLQRQEGAIGSLKETSSPISGLTTLTQFGPVAVAIGVLLRRTGSGYGHGIVWMVLLAGVRTVFYAERLALVEVAIPLVLVVALTTQTQSRWRPFVRGAPLILAPAIWALFAVSEYARSWIYFQSTTAMPFYEWVTARLLGYYVTAFNNSALFATSHEHIASVPYFSVQMFWNAPGIGGVLSPPVIWGIPADSWWQYLLQVNANPALNSQGSFLVTFGELGMIGLVMFWLVVGLILGAIFSAMTKGSVPALLAYCTLFIGVLELSRFIYWTQGRAFPVVVALVVIALTFKRVRIVQGESTLSRRGTLRS
jgi:hypothetical protein